MIAQFRRFIAVLLAITLVVPLPARAAMLSTESALGPDRERIAQILDRADAQAQLQAFGVGAAEVKARVGDEVVQIYLRDEAASVTRPLKELKKFQRVSLAPGEKRTLRFELTPDDLSIWNLEMKRVVEPGKFTVMAGPNSRDLKAASFTVTG